MTSIVMLSATPCGGIVFTKFTVSVTLRETVRLERLFVFAAGNAETKTGSSLEYAANGRTPDGRPRAA